MKWDTPLVVFMILNQEDLNLDLPTTTMAIGCVVMGDFEQLWLTGKLIFCIHSSLERLSNEPAGMYFSCLGATRMGFFSNPDYYSKGKAAGSTGDPGSNNSAIVRDGRWVTANFRSSSFSSRPIAETIT